MFVTSGGLAKVQEIEADPGTALMECITQINACFPDEIVRYYTPGYPDSLLEKVEQFVPQIEIMGNESVEEESKICGPAPNVSSSNDIGIDSESFLA